MRRHVIIWTFAVLALAALAGCAKKTEQAQQATSADSLLASNPTEQQPGNLTPQAPYDQNQPQGQQPPAATTTSTNPPPASHPVTHSSKSKSHSSSTAPPSAPASRGVTIPAGTEVGVTVNTALTSETAQPGDAWSGTVKDAVILGTEAPIPAGSVVHGVVRTSVPAEKGSRAVLVLAVTSVEVGGHTQSIDATADSLVASSTRARNVGAVAGGAAAGAIIGKAIGGGKGALIGGLLGAGGATAAVSKTKGYQSVVKEGQEMTFRVDHPTTFHLSDQATATR